MTEWQLFNNGLPHVSVRELEIQYTAGKIRAATFGRGVWESDLNIFPTSVNSVNPLLIRVYPNPVNEKLTISTPYKLSRCSVQIYTITGQIVLKENIISDNTNISCSHLEKGVYVYKIFSGSDILKTDKLLVY